MSRILLVSALFITLNLSGCGAEDDQNAEVEASVCGDGMVTGNEGCDGQDMAGLTCGDFPRFGEYGGGALTCSSTCELVLDACQSCFTFPCGDYGGNQRGDGVENIQFVPGNQAAIDYVGTEESFTMSDLYLKGPTHGGEVKMILLFGTASWCPACAVEARYLNTLADQYRDQGLLVVGVVQEDSNYNDADAFEANAYANRYDLTFPVVAGRIPESYYESPSFPLNLFVQNRDMTVVRASNGAPPEGFLNATIEAYLANN